MREYIEAGAVDLIPDNVAENTVIQEVLKGVKKEIYEQALVDGCNENQAMLVALGVDITIPDAEVIPIGWYKFRREYAQIFCYDWEM